MRILLANGTAYPTIGGVENSLRYIGRELLRAGHEVEIFCFQTSADQPLRMEHEGIEIVRCPYTPSRWPHVRMRQQVERVRREIPSVLYEFQPDAVWSRSACVGLGVSLSGFQGPLLQVLCTTTHMDTRGLYLQNAGMPWRRRLLALGLYPLHYQQAYRIEHKLLMRCQPVVFSENMRTQLQGSNDRCARQIKMIPPGVDAEMFSPQNATRFSKQVEEAYGLTPDIPSVLYVGRLSAAKNIPLLIDAVAKLEPSAKLVLVGSGPERDRLQHYANRRNATSRIVFAGPQDQWLPGFYAQARVCVLPTTIESFGQVYLEALACGTPVVGFAGDGRRVVTATQEIIRDDETGAVVKEVSHSALADKIDAILSLDNAAYDAMSQLAREDVRRRFSWARFVQSALRLSGAGSSEGDCESDS